MDINAMNKFLDDSEMSSWSKSAIYFMAKNGIIEGIGDNTFGVSNDATIEQSIIISKRIHEKYKESGIIIADYTGLDTKNKTFEERVKEAVDITNLPDEYGIRELNYISKEHYVSNVSITKL